MTRLREILGKARKEKLPIVDDDFHLKGLITIKDIEKQIKYPYSAHDAQGRLLCGAAVGMYSQHPGQSCRALYQAKVDAIVIDTAHGHSANVLRTFKMVKEKYPDLQVIAGNVATGCRRTGSDRGMGVDAVKVGIGPGSICTTRVVAGIGVPQITAIMEAYDAAMNVRNPSYRRWRYQVFRRYHKGSGSRCQRMYDGKSVRRLQMRLLVISSFIRDVSTRYTEVWDL